MEELEINAQALAALGGLYGLLNAVACLLAST
jgi:hypothetical protein